MKKKFGIPLVNELYKYYRKEYDFHYQVKKHNLSRLIFNRKHSDFIWLIHLIYTGCYGDFASFAIEDKMTGLGWKLKQQLRKEV